MRRALTQIRQIATAGVLGCAPKQDALDRIDELAREALAIGGEPTSSTGSRDLTPADVCGDFNPERQAR